jgi:hypothetical protein
MEVGESSIFERKLAIEKLNKKVNRQCSSNEGRINSIRDNTLCTEIPN